MNSGVNLKVVEADVLSFRSDLLALKYAQYSFGADAAAVDVAGIDKATLPQVGRSLLVRQPAGLAASNLLFIGVEPLSSFDYRSIREFSRRALAQAADIEPVVRTISMTLHGAGFGLDETEAFEAEIAGIVEALDAGQYPDDLRNVSIVELDSRRAKWMTGTLATLFGRQMDDSRTVSYSRGSRGHGARRIDSVGYDSAGRSHAFVAMPFGDSFEDVFHFGIASPVRAMGLLCERMDQIAFVGDIIERMKQRITSAAVMIADLSEANPNVYLEVGYAWGVDVPCVLLCNRKTDLKFDVRGQRCLFYQNIVELERLLASELTELTPKLA